MKKYLVLTSVLALAACGGGSGGGSVTPPRAADLVGANVVGANNDNVKITTMASAVVVKNNGELVDLARAASAPDTSYAGYTIYKLNNVDFKMIQDSTAAFNFDIDEHGKIASVTGVVGGGELFAVRDTDAEHPHFNAVIYQFVKSDLDDREVVTVSADSTGIVRKSQLDAALAAAVVRGDLSQEEANAGFWNRLTQTWEFKKNGEYNDGLTYSDFGFLQADNVTKDEKVIVDENGNWSLDAGGTHKDYSAGEHRALLAFAGGYDIPRSNPTNGMTFHGKAIGVLNTSVHGDQNFKGGATYGYNHSNLDPSTRNTDESATMTTDSATLVFNQGNEVLTMPFGSDGTVTDNRTGTTVDWYDVTATKTAGGTTVTFALPTGADIPRRFKTDVNFEGDASHLVLDRHYYYEDPEDTSSPTHADAVNTNNVVVNGLAGNTNTEIVKSVSDMKYYGAGTPTEATGMVDFLSVKDLEAGNEVSPTATSTREFRFQAGYGLKTPQD